MVLRAKFRNALNPPFLRLFAVSLGFPLEPHEIIHDHFTRFRKQLGDMDSNTKLILDEL